MASPRVKGKERERERALEDEKEMDSLLLQEEEEAVSRQSSSNSISSLNKEKKEKSEYDLSKKIGIVVDNGTNNITDVPPLALDPRPLPAPIQQLELKAMKSKAVEQIQTMLQKRRKKNKNNWKKRWLFIIIILLSILGSISIAAGEHIYRLANLLFSHHN